MSVLVVDGLYSFTWYGSAGAGHNYVRAPKVYRRGRPAALKALAKLQREGKPAKPKSARKPAGAATVATVAAKILPSDRAQLKLPGLPRTRKAARTVGAGA